MLSVLHTLTGNKFVGLEVRRRLKKAAHVGRKVGQCHPHCHCFLVVILLLSFCSPSCQTLDLSSLCHCPWHHSHFILIFNLSNLYQLIILSRVEKGRPALFSLSLPPASLIVLMLIFAHLSGKGVMWAIQVQPPATKQSGLTDGYPFNLIHLGQYFGNWSSEWQKFNLQQECLYET